MVEVWGHGAVGLGAVQTELSRVQAAIEEARHALRCAMAVGWQSTAADEFRARVEDLSMSATGHAHVIREALRTAARLEVQR